MAFHILALLSGQRLQTLKVFSVKSLTLTDTKCVFQINVPLKITRSGGHMCALEFCEYTPSDYLRIVKHLKCYVNSMSTLRRDCDQLLPKISLVGQPPVTLLGDG